LALAAGFPVYLFETECPNDALVCNTHHKSFRFSKSSNHQQLPVKVGDEVRLSTGGAGRSPVIDRRSSRRFYSSLIASFVIGEPVDLRSLVSLIVNT